jgi:hypothetical protein
VDVIPLEQTSLRHLQLPNFQYPAASAHGQLILRCYLSPYNRGRFPLHLSLYGELVKSWAIPLAVLSVVISLACGGGGSKTSSSSGGGIVTPPTGGGTSGGTGNSTGATAVAVNAGSATTGVVISVTSGTPTLNAQVLGVASVSSSGGSASNTGGVVQRGAQSDVLLFGKGLGSDLTISVLGPNDVSITNIRSIKSTSGLSGVQFTVDVNSNAAPGARTVLLQDAQGHMTTFTGGLEIQ